MKKRILSILSVLALLLCVCAAQAEEPAKEASYQRALEFLEAGQFDLAISIFEMLGDYRDSSAQIVICQNAKLKVYYDRAVELFNSGDYDAAKQVFEMLGDYGDSAIQAVRCDTQKKQARYDQADALAQNGEYRKAREAFLMLGDFSDSAERVTEMDEAILQSQYDAAKNLETSGKYEEAIEAYQALGDYRDAAGRIEECRHQIAVRDISAEVTGALKRSPFNAEEAYALIAKARELGIDTEEWLDRAYDLETAARYGNAKYLDEDTDGDGQAERFVADQNGLVMLRRETTGLTVVSAADGPRYTSIRMESDPFGRKYLIASNKELADVYLLDGVPGRICSVKNPAGDADVTLTASGFIISYTLTRTPNRRMQTEYIVLARDQSMALDTAVVVDMENYPRVDSARTLISLYQEACAYPSEAEFGKLESSEADRAVMETIRDWLAQNPVLERAELVVWNEDSQDFTCVVDSASGRLTVRVVMDDSGELALRGL